MMGERPVPKAHQGGFGLIELVVVIAIIAVLAGLYFGPGKRGGKDQRSLPAQAVDRAVDTACQSNLRQLRMNIQMETMAGEPPPRSLKAAVKGLGAGFEQCPTSGEPYVYDSQSGSVRCTTSGHEEY